MNLRPILTLASVVLAIYYVFYADAPLWGRVTVAVLMMASFLLPASWLVAAILIQLGVALFVLLRLQLDA